MHEFSGNKIFSASNDIPILPSVCGGKGCLIK